MAPVLPRVPAFPIVGERNALTVIGSGLTIPASVHQDCPLIGKEAPEILLPDHLGRRCSLHATIALGRPIILFFFPLAGSPHCTMESCMFRDALGITPVFAELQAIVIGISQDPPARSKRFVDEHHLGYQILHDEKREAMDTYGVPRTWMGLLDQRCTFVIDPSGIVRSMVQGVFDARGHVRFAERWLIRFEHELSQRSRKAVAVEQSQRTMIEHEDEEELDESQIGIAYGGANTAIIGGIDAAPRHGAAPIVTRSKVRSKSMSRSVSNGDARHAPIAFDTSINEKGREADVSSQEKNLWKNWKVLLQQLSSADDKPPPLVMMRSRSRTESVEKSSDALSTPMKKSGSSSKLLPRSRSSTKLKDLDRSSRRPSEASRKSLSGDTSAEIVPITHLNGAGEGIPPVPPLFAVFDGGASGGVDSNGIVQPAQGSRTGKRNDSNSSEHGTSMWGTEGSLSSHVSTAATSLFTGSRQGHGSQQTTKPSAITSEVLMPGDVFDLDVENGPLPAVVRQIPGLDDISVAPAPPPKSRPSRSEVAVPAISENFNQQPLHRPIASANPQDSEELSEDSDMTRYRSQRLRSPDDGKLQSSAVLRSSSQQSGLSSGRSTPRAFIGGRTSGEPFTRGSPMLDGIRGGEEGRVRTPTNFGWRSQKLQASPSIDGVYRITTPTLADAAEPIGRVDVETGLSPRPRSLRLDAQVRSPDSRLRRPINPPRDAVVAGLGQTRQVLSNSDSPRSSDSHPRFQSTVAPEDSSPLSNILSLEDEDAAQIQRVVRRTSLRPDKPTKVDQAMLNNTPPRAHTRTSTHTSPSSNKVSNSNPLMMSVQPGGMQTGEALRDGLDRLIINSDVTHQSSSQDDRRPSASSTGTFGRRDSFDLAHDGKEDDEADDDNISVY